MTLNSPLFLCELCQVPWTSLNLSFSLYKVQIRPTLQSNVDQKMNACDTAFFSLVRRHPILEILWAFSMGNLLDLCEFTLLVIRLSCGQAKSWRCGRTFHDPRYTPASRPVLKKIPGLGVALGRNRGGRRVFRKKELVSSQLATPALPGEEMF